MTLYRIAKWNETYETHETRKLARLGWIPVPNRHDGLGFRTVAAEKDSAALFGVWNLLVQIASKSKRDTRGELARDGIPLTARTIATMTGFQEKAIARALSFFSQQSMGWLIAEQYQTDLPLVSHDVPTLPGTTPDERRERKKEGKPEAASPTLLPFDSSGFRDAWNLFEQHRREIRKPLTKTATDLTFDQLSKIGEVRAIAAIRHTIQKGWQGIREPEGAPTARFTPAKPKTQECPGWKGILNHQFPNSIFAVGGDCEAHEWGDVSNEGQQAIWKHHHATK